ncbi:MAG: hypothetical protein NVV74_17225 [Magnetospirillum sp.]|nr:hypothetical protein [Magnetospirillum sp.]
MSEMEAACLGIDAAAAQQGHEGRAGMDDLHRPPCFSADRAAASRIWMQVTSPDWNAAASTITPPAPATPSAICRRSCTQERMSFTGARATAKGDGSVVGDGIAANHRSDACASQVNSGTIRVYIGEDMASEQITQPSSGKYSHNSYRH